MGIEFTFQDDNNTREYLVKTLVFRPARPGHAATHWVKVYRKILDRQVRDDYAPPKIVQSSEQKMNEEVER